MTHAWKTFFPLVLAGSLFAATPKAYLRGPTEAKADQSILLKFAGTVSDEPVVIEQVSGPEQLSLAHLFDRDGKLVYAECMATIPGLYRFSLIAEGSTDGAPKPTRSYAFCDVVVTPASTDTIPDEVVPDVDDPCLGLAEPPGVIPLAIGKPSKPMKLKSGQGFVRFKFTPKSSGMFAVATRGSGAWKMELAGPDDWSDTFAVDELFSGVNANAKIEATLAAGRAYYAKVKPLEPYQGKAFTIMVAKSSTPPKPPQPLPVPPKPIPPTPEPPVPSGELKVLFLHESESLMTERQLQVWHSPDLEQTLMKNTTPGPDAVPGFRKWDKDQDPSDDTPEWAEMLNWAKAELARTGTQLPVMVVFRGGKGTLNPLPASPQEAISLIQK